MADEPLSPEPAPLERKLATILSADVAEYSRLMGEDEEGTLKTFRSHKEVFESLVADGVYAGPICYGKGPVDDARCFRAQATVANGKITGQWPVGHESGATMILLGSVLPSGDATIHMHTEGGNAAHVTRIDLTGKLQDGHLNANGAFRNGRSATITWYKGPAATKN